jgi:uncharacterized protein YneF (UPF0154 family)
MFNAWFILYHKYSRQMWYDAEAVRRFAGDCAWAAKNGIGLLIVESFFRNYPEYLTFWSRKTMQDFLKAAHDQGIKVLPYASPTGVDVTSDFYKFHGDECSVKVRSVFGTNAKVFGFISLPDGDPYWKDYRGTHLAWVPADPATGWKDYYLETCEGLLEFGFDGIYLDQHQEATESAEHPDINEEMMDMLSRMRQMVKQAHPQNVICANVMAGIPAGKKGEEFIRRTQVADYGLTESADSDISGPLQVWMEKTGLDFFFFSHGTFESHQRKVAIAKKLNQPLCLFSPAPLDETDPRILKLYEVAG